MKAITFLTNGVPIKQEIFLLDLRSDIIDRPNLSGPTWISSIGLFQISENDTNLTDFEITLGFGQSLLKVPPKSGVLVKN